jgi:DNA repair exonuclease SbcCD ATPase subunit
MEPRRDSWESVGWEPASKQPEEAADRDEVLRLARELAASRERQNVEALLQVEDLKRALRERAADVARRELDVERRIRELDDLDGRGREGRRLRVRRAERPRDVDRLPEDERLTRRESEVQQRLDALVPRERAVAERETALRAREREVMESKESVERRKLELESSHARLNESEAAQAELRAALEDQERQLEASRAEISWTTDELVARAAALEAAEQELAQVRPRRGDSVPSEHELGDGEREPERAQALDARERRLATREREAAVVDERSTVDADRGLSQIESRLAAREAELLAREAELLRLQSGLGAQQESIRRRERALEDAERQRDVPTTPYVSFTEGLDAFSGARPRSR